MNCWLRAIHSRTRASPRVPYSRSATIRYMVAFAVLSDARLPLARGSASQFPRLPQAENDLVLQICTRPSNFIVLGRFAHRAVLLLARAAPGSWVPLPLSFLGTIRPKKSSVG